MRSSPTPVRHLVGALLLGAALLSASACSSGGDGAKATTTTAAKGTKATTTTVAEGGTTTTKAPRDPESITASEADYVKAMKPLIAATTGMADSQDDQGACVAPKWVAAIGVETFKEHGLAPEDLGTSEGALDGLGLTDDQASEMVAAFDACDVDLVEIAITQITSGTKTSDAALACLRQNITTEAVNNAFKAHLTGDDGPSEAFTAAQKCFAAG